MINRMRKIHLEAKKNDMEKVSPALKTMENLLTDSSFLRIVRSAQEKFSRNLRQGATDDEQLAHEQTLKNMRDQYSNLRGTEKEMFRRMYEQRKRTLGALQPEDESGADSDGKESVKKLKDIVYLGQILGLEGD